MHILFDRHFCNCLSCIFCLPSPSRLQVAHPGQQHTYHSLHTAGRTQKDKIVAVLLILFKHTKIFVDPTGLFLPHLPISIVSFAAGRFQESIEVRSFQPPVFQKHSANRNFARIVQSELVIHQTARSLQIGSTKWPRSSGSQNYSSVAKLYTFASISTLQTTNRKLQWPNVTLP